MRILTSLIVIFLIFFMSDEHKAHIKPDVVPVNLTDILQKENWSTDDYNLLSSQTGLTSISLDILKEDNINKILSVQKAYLSPDN